MSMEWVEEIRVRRSLAGRELFDVIVIAQDVSNGQQHYNVTRDSMERLVKDYSEELGYPRRRTPDTRGVPA